MHKILYQNFDIILKPTKEGGYIAKVIDSPAGQALNGFSFPLSQAELENFFLKGVSEIETIKEIGGRLFNAVFQNEVGICLYRSIDIANRQGHGLRIRLRLTDAPELFNLPWEYLYQANANQFLCLNRQTPIVRYLDIPKIITPLNIKFPLRILVFISSPTNLVQFDVNNEKLKIQNALTDLEKRGLVSFTFTKNATVSELLKNLRQSEFHIFHFIGHEGSLGFENEDKSVDYVSAEQLGPMLTNHRSMRLVVLNSCEGARTSIADPFAGVAQSLIGQGIPAVIGMQFPITDNAAISLYSEFYEAIVDGYPVDASLAEARKSIFAQGNPIEWGTPVLYMRSSDGYIFDFDMVLKQETAPWKSKDNVLFTAYYPNEIWAETRYILLLYAHLQSELSIVDKDVKKFEKELSDKTYRHKTAKSSTQIRTGTPITIVPECTVIEFNPSSLTKKWDGNWIRFDFQYKPTKDLVDNILFIRFSILISCIEVASIKVSIDVLDQECQYKSIPIDKCNDNKLAAAKVLNSRTSNMYQNIFISYSRKDKEVVKAYRLAQLAVGNDVFMDTYSTRPGENWRRELAEAIDTADIFQLFWSKNSARSAAVRDEWEYALKYRCPQTRCEGFIRPVYWELPLPAEPPNELKHLSFRYIPLRFSQKRFQFIKDILVGFSWKKTKI